MRRGWGWGLAVGLTVVAVLVGRHALGGEADAGTPTGTAGVDGDRKASLERIKELDAKVKELHGKGKYALAVPLAEEALAIRERVLGRDHPGVAEGLHNLGLLLMAQGAFEVARPVFDRALALRERALGKDHLDVAQSLNSLARLLQSQGAYDAARPLFERSLGICERTLGKDHPIVAVGLNNLAMLHQTQGAYDAARPLYERALAIREKALGKDDPDVAISLNNLAVLHQARGAYDAARRLVERALDIWEKALGKDHPHVAKCLNNLAWLHQAQGAHDTARLLFERALAIKEKALGRDHPDVAGSLNNLAVLLKAQGAYDAARPLLERALAISEKALGRDHPDVAGCLASLGDLLRIQGAADAARPLFERALAIDERAYGKDHPDVATGLNNLAVLLDSQGDHDAARPLYERALAIREKALGKDHPDVAHSLNNLAALLRAQGESAAARPLVERALAIREKALGRDHPDVAATLSHLALLVHTEGAGDAARPLLERAVRIVEQHTRRSLGGATSAERVALVALTQRTLRTWLQFAGLTGAEAYPAVLRWKGLAGRAGEAERRAVRGAGGEVRALFDDLGAARNRLGRLVQGPPGDATKLERWRAAVATATARCEALELELAQRSAAHREASGRLDIGVPAVQAELRADEALVDLLRYGDRYAAWIVRHEGTPVRIELGRAAGVTETAGPIEAAAQRFRDATLRADSPLDPELLEAGTALRALVWAPVEERLGEGARTVYVVPDAALAAVPFAALPGRLPGRFLIDERTLVHLAAAQDLVPLKTARPPGIGALLMGGIDYERAEEAPPEPVSVPVPVPESATPSADILALTDPRPFASLYRAPAGAHFDALAATGPEIDALAAHLRASAPGEPLATLRGAHATEGALRRLASGRRLVHLATHGFVRHDLRSALERPVAMTGTAAARDSDPSTELRTALVSPGQERHLTGFDPMLLSGLALAGANARAGGGDDDGVLTALEAAGLDLDSVDLVTLSACDTAGGTPRAGEGVLGLVRGFREAGAKAIVASLWRVHDDATRRLMGDLYGGALARKDPRPAALALREAALALRSVEIEVRDDDASAREGRDVLVRRRAFEAPRYWAAFVAYGAVR